MESHYALGHEGGLSLYLLAMRLFGQGMPGAVSPVAGAVRHGHSVSHRVHEEWERRGDSGSDSSGAIYNRGVPDRDHCLLQVNWSVCGQSAFELSGRWWTVSCG